MAISTGFASARGGSQNSGLVSALIFLPPALMLFTVFIVLPIGEAAWYSFFNWNGMGELDKFIGPRNFMQVLGHTVFQRAFLNNLLIIFVSLAVQLPLALAMAILVSDRLAGAVAFRMIFFLPYIL